MSDHSYTTSFTVDQTPREVIDAVRNVRGWWSNRVDGGTTEPGDQFDYRGGDSHRATIRVTEVVLDRKVSWFVVANHFDFTEDKTEWADNTITFEVAERDGRTELRFTQHGLVPEYECYEVCSNAWSFFVNESLHDLITTGAGQPMLAGRPHKLLADSGVAG